MKKQAKRNRPNQKQKQRIRKGKTGRGTSGYQHASLTGQFTGVRPVLPHHPILPNPLGNRMDDPLMDLALMTGLRRKKP